MKFTKMHGCGNDYIYVNLFREQVENPKEMARQLSRRCFGIGADGLITIGPSAEADFAMRIYNADGSEAEMCGNGIRCVAKYVYDHGMTCKQELMIETGAGVKRLKLLVEGTVKQVQVDMGEPILAPERIPVNLPGENVISVPVEMVEQNWLLTCVSMGNPHAVIFVLDLSKLPIEELGPRMEGHSLFPKRTNVEFVEVLGRGELRMRVWERGAGETLACGTGACASVMAAVLNGFTDDRVLVHLAGGDLRIEYHRENKHLFMTGPAVTVFEGEIEEALWKRGES